MAQPETSPQVDRASNFLLDFGLWYIATLYSLAGVFAGIVEGIFTEGKTLIESVEKSDGYKDLKVKADDTSKTLTPHSLTNGFAQKVQQSANDVKKDVKQTARR